MPQRIVHPSYYDDAYGVAYPFSPETSRTNGTVVIEDDIFIDARLFVPDGRFDVFVSKIVIAASVTITLADSRGELATADFDRVAQPTAAHFWRGETYIGLLQFHPGHTAQTDAVTGVSKLCGWPDGTYLFTAQQTRLAATVLTPQPQLCVREFVVPDGTVDSDEVVLVGEQGIQLTVAGITESSSSNSLPQAVIRVDVVGDPLAVRRQCEEEGIEDLRSGFLRAIRFGNDLITPGPDGSVRLSVDSTFESAAKPALRVQAAQNGLTVGFVKI